MRKRRLALVVIASMSLVLAATGSVSAAPSERHVNMLDDCDSVSFNAVIGPGTCSKSGSVTFDAFIGQLLSMGQAPAWRFAPGALMLSAGGSIDAYNRGGEAHTFTEVAAFGGGCIEEINALLGLTAVPECDDFALFLGTLAGPGEEVETEALSPGVHLFECLIHPWMRTTATVD